MSSARSALKFGGKNKNKKKNNSKGVGVTAVIGVTATTMLFHHANSRLHLGTLSLSALKEAYPWP